MPIVINAFDSNVESGDSQTPNLTGDDNGFIYAGTGIDTTAGGQMDGATQNVTAFTNDSVHDTQTTFGTRTFTHASGHILGATIPSGTNTFTQNTSGTPFNDTTYHVFSVSGLDQTTPFKESSEVTYNLAAPGAITYDIEDGGLAVLIILTNVNNPQVPAGWTQQGGVKSLGIITDYIVCTRIATSQEIGATVTPTMDGDGTGRGLSRVWVYNPSTGVTGSLDETLGDTTSTASGQVGIDVTGTLNETLANAVSSANGTVGVNVTGTLNVTLADTVAAASGQVGENVTGSLNETLANATSSASGQVGIDVTGTLNVALGETTSSATGQVGVDVTGTLNVALGETTSNANGIVGTGVAGTLDQTLADVTSDASGQVGLEVTGTLNVTLGDTTADAEGFVGTYVTGTLNATLSDAIGVATGVVGTPDAVTGTLNVTLSDASARVSGIVGTLEGAVTFTPTIAKRNFSVEMEPRKFKVTIPKRVFNID